MIQLLFFIRFRSQLRRIRANVIFLSEKSVSEAVETAGGTIRNERRFLFASFDEDVIGFWLDIITLLETVKTSLEKVSPELYGYAVVLGRDIPEHIMEPLCRTLSSAPEKGTGIWCDPAVQQALSPYGNFGSPLSEDGFPQGPHKRGNKRFSAGGYAQLVFTPLAGIPPLNAFPFREIIRQAIKQGEHKSVVLLGPEFIGKRDGLYNFCAEALGNIPPLIIRFGGGGPVCLVDALSPKIRNFIGVYARVEILEVLDTLGPIIFRDRLRDEFSAYMIKNIRRFFQTLLKAYIAAVKPYLPSAILILENMEQADEAAVRIFIDSFNALEAPDKPLIYGICVSAGDDPFEGGQLKKWKEMFSRIIKFSPDNFPARKTVELPRELWEISYALVLLGRYFPPFLFPLLFQEDGRNPAIIFRALEMLSALGVVDSVEDPRPRIHDFTTQAEKILGERAEKGRALARDRLLAWIGSGKILPCFNLIKILSELGGGDDDVLILKAIRADVINGTYREIQKTVHKRRLAVLVGPERSFSLLYIFRTLQSLMWGDQTEIREAFLAPFPDGPVSPACKTQMLVNFAAYNLGIHDNDAALKAVKEAMFLSQEQKGGISSAYRLFSLANLAKQRIDEALAYMSFSMEIAEKTGQLDELGIAAYYAGGLYFLFGNLSKAEYFVRQSEEVLASLGLTDWADRSRFLQGKFRFETGHYQDALDIFEELQKRDTESSSPEKKYTLSAWVYRAKVFLRNPLTKKPSPLRGDARLFEIEASYLAGDYEQTVALSDKLRSGLPADTFLYTEQPDWRSGFAQCESLLFPCRNLWDRLSAVYYALARSRLSPDKAELEQIINDMQRLMRDELFPGADPNSAFYFFAYYRILHETGAVQVDTNTAISMAFKRLQRRASRIDDAETRQAFLSLPYWNGALSLAARDYKLI
jgi:tetratricopeptide (TPR) repeat protein